MKLIGSGSFASVYAEGNLVYKKFKKFDKRHDVAPEILREIALLRQIDHPNIVKFVDVQFSGKRPVLVMENCGVSLTSWVCGTITSARIEIWRDLTIQMMRAIAYLHSRNIWHRDIKPDNILIKDGVVRLCDFSISKEICGDRLRNQPATLRYRAPELFGGGVEYDERVDVWAAGLVIYYIITGKHFFTGTDKEVHAALKSVVDINVGITDKRLHSMLRSMLQYDYKSRARAAEVLEILGDVSDDVLHGDVSTDVDNSEITLRLAPYSKVITPAARPIVESILRRRGLDVEEMVIGAAVLIASKYIDSDPVIARQITRKVIILSEAEKSLLNHIQFDIRI